MRLTAIAIALILSAPAQADDSADTFAMMCSACHGEKGGGDGPASASLDPKPAKFNDAAFWKERDDAGVAKIIKEGGAANGKSALMAPFGGTMDDAQITAMVAFLRTLAPSEKAPK